MTVSRVLFLAGSFGRLIAAALALVACGPGHAADNSSAQACRVTLTPRTQDPLSTPPPLVAPFAAPRSTLVVHAEIPLALVQRNLEAKVSRRVADVPDQDIGVAGRLEYTADRGAFAVSVQGDALVVETPVIVHARACAKGRCFASCDPEARVTAHVPLRLGADYKFRNPAVNIAITKGCQISALGGFARIDVTPMLESRLSQEKPRLEAQIRNELPDLRPEVDRIWNDLSHPRALPLGACLILLPEGLSQGVPSGTPDAARLTFGLLARPELRTRCGGEPPRMTPLPPLHDDNQLPPNGDIHLAIVLSPETAASAFEGAQDVIDLGAAHAHLQHASGATGGTAKGLSLDLIGEVCGPVGVRATSAGWTDDGRSVHLAQVTLFPGDLERLTAGGLAPDVFAKSIERVPIPVPIAVADLQTTIPELAKSESDPRVDVSTQITDSRAEAAGLRGPGEIVAVVELHGSATIRAK